MVVLGLVAVAIPPAQALVAAVPLETLVDEADTIVIGKVTRIEGAVVTRQFGGAERVFDAAVVEVEAVLKGAAKPREVRLLQPARGGLAISSDRRFAVGHEAVWILSREPEAGYHGVRHPFAVQPIARKAELTKLVQDRENLPGGKAVAGLVVRAEVVTRGPQQSIRLSVKNVSDRPIVLCNYAGNRVVEMDWIGQDGQRRTQDLYEFLKRARLRPLSEQDFQTLQPGAVAQVGPGGRFGGGIVLEKPGPGEHRVTLRYVNKEDGKQFGLKDVWTGTAVANEVTITVK
jgi:hypothetical protein